ncbi:hypothetical protein PIB30_007212 [Stylosanthes scabra]|uniref:Uncharacterized protein n=1 Tax=Stylosanthes scabra TaxID=79078 RepID=A0ABU6V3A7_9FABA|nr:hypothetical protein [Stylosanthes scabra]
MLFHVAKLINLNHYLLPDELASKINRDEVNSLYFIDNADNCVQVEPWRLNNEIYMNGFDLDTFRNLSNAGDWIGVKLKYFVAGVLAVEVFGTNYLPLDAWPIQNLYVGRVLPDHHKRVMEKGFNIKLDGKRELSLHRYMVQEQVLN